MALSLFHSYRGIPVLMFHGLCERTPEFARFTGGRTCLLEVRAFERIVDELSKTYRILRPEELESIGRSNDGRPPLLLTFDDALASVIDLACPILKRRGLSAIVFVTVDWVENKKTPDIFLLEKAVWERLPVTVEISMSSFSFRSEVGRTEDAGKFFSELWNRLHAARVPPLSLAASNIQFNGNKWQRDDTAEDRQFWFPASWEELRNAAREGTLEIGSHMLTHNPLGWMSEEDQRCQLEGSKGVLERNTEAPVLSCSYPHGIMNELTVTLAEKNYRWGFTNRPGRIGKRTRRGLAPRYHVPGESPFGILDTLRWGPTLSRIKRILLNEA
jgi:peptidoglycan/xylan/chitin deacetylase (PgdA/CDA1 family)